jgi:LisH
MNYLVRQGYPTAAASFAKEANISLSRESMESISLRTQIRNKIHGGDIEAAIEDINTLNPQVRPVRAS